MSELTIVFDWLKKLKMNLLCFTLVAAAVFVSILIFNDAITLGLADTGTPAALKYAVMTSMIMALPFFLAKRKWIVFAGAALFQAYLLANVLYFRVYDTVMPLYAFGQAPNLNGLGDSIMSLLKPIDAALFAPTVAAIVVYAVYFKRRLEILTFRQRLIIPAFMLLPITVVLARDILTSYHAHGKVMTFERFKYNQTYGTYAFGPLAHIGWQLHELSGRKVLTDADVDGIRAWLNQRENNVAHLTGDSVETEKNILVILVESFESWPIGAKIGNVELTPNLNKSIALPTTLYAPYVVPQTRDGRSSDAQLLLNTGLLPIAHGATSFRFPDNSFYSLAKALKTHGEYLASTFIGEEPSYWNQSRMNPCLGFDTLVSSLHFDMSDMEGMGLSDESMFDQSLRFLQGMPRPFYVQMITLTSHMPFRLSPSRHTLSLPADVPPLMADYARCISYVDRALGKFIGELKASRLYDSTMILITGDHEAIGTDERTTLLKNAYGRQCLTQQYFLPLIILNSPVGGRYDEIMGQADIYPTLLDLLDLSSYKWKGLGRSIFLKGRDHFAVTGLDDVVTNGRTIPPRAVGEARRTWEISDMIIEGNYFRRCPL